MPDPRPGEAAGPQQERTWEALTRRIERLEAIEEIRRLPVLYALYLDRRDLDALAGLFVDDGRKVFYRLNDAGVSGGQALRDSFLVSQGPFVSSLHFVTNHDLVVDTTDTAHGSVYTRVEQELPDVGWTIATSWYQDRYARVGGRWLFAERRTYPWYFTTWDEAPVGPKKLRWPSGFGPPNVAADGEVTRVATPHQEAPIPDAWPTWRAFQARRPAGSDATGK
jgi:hypothetical protein